MQLTDIGVLNFRGFSDLHLSLDPELAVLAGVNGAGKTAVLSAIAVSLGTWLLEFNTDKRESISICERDVRLACHVRGEIANLEPAFPVVVSALGNIGLPTGETVEIGWTRSLDRLRGKTRYGEASDLRAVARQWQRVVEDGGDVTLPVVAYYGAGRLWSQKRETGTAHGSRMKGYADALDPLSNHKQLTRWMKWRETARAQRLRDALADGDMHPERIAMHGADAIAAAVSNCIPGASRFFYNVSLEWLQVAFEDGRMLPFHALSDGYRNLLGMVADIAWRCVQLNPHLKAGAPRDTPGVVLVDELDVHLHPGWQRHVLDDLRRTFPKIQFIVTTHSPQVLASVEPKYVRFLGLDGTVATPGVSLGLDTNTMLRDLMGVPERPERFQRQFASVAEQIEGGDFAEARAQLLSLSRTLGADDPNITALEWELRAASLGSASPVDEGDGATG